MDVKIFPSMSNLYSEIEADKQSNKFIHNRFPVRFIFLPNFERMKELYTKITSEMGCSTSDLSELLPSEDGWITQEDITRTVKRLVSNKAKKDVIIFPVSEIVRFYPDGELISTFLSLCEIETQENKKLRIYIPLVGLHQRFNKFSLHFAREWGPIWRLDEEVKEKLRITMCVDVEKCKITHTSDKEILYIDKTKKWLSLWREPIEKLFKKDVVCHSETLSLLHKNSQPDSFFNFVVVANQKETLMKLYNIQFIEHIPFLPNESSLWDEFESILENEDLPLYSTFDAFVSNLFNVKKVKGDDIVKLWLQNNREVYKWILKYYVLSKSNFEGSYIRIVLEKISDYDDSQLELELWTRVFKFEKIDSELIGQRIKYIQQFYDVSKKSPTNMEAILREELQTILEKYNNTKEKMQLLTGLTRVEKEKVFELTKEAISHSELSRNDLLELYKRSYHSLYNYLNDIELDNETEENSWIKIYFNEYRWSKVLNEKSEKLSELLMEKNRDAQSFWQWYSQLDTSYNSMNDNSSAETNLLWIDAVGLEWINLIYHNLLDKVEIERILFARSNIPSTTDCNKFEVEKKNHIRVFDSFTHNAGSYNYPNTFISEIDTLEDIIAKNLEVNHRSIILSDHGLSTFVRKVHGSTKKYSFNDAEHEGRCMWTDNEFSQDTDYIQIVSPEYTKKKGAHVLVALKHDSLSDVPRREVHGGATPEEVIVPFLIISPKVSEKEHYTISPEIIEVRQGDPVFKDIVISPKPRSAVLVGKREKEWKLKYNTKAKNWEVNLKGLETGEHKLALKLSGMIYKKIKVKVVGGMIVRDLI